MMVTKVGKDEVEVVVEFGGRVYASLSSDQRWGDDETGELVTSARTKYHLHLLAGRITPRFRKN